MGMATAVGPDAGERRPYEAPRETQEESIPGGFRAYGRVAYGSSD